MAQLNPNFEIDYSDINSYEQIQLLNDAQQAKENLLMHKAYKDPSDDEIIRNRFSSFTFVDFCPKIYTKSRSLSNSNLLPQVPQTDADNLSSAETDPMRYFQLEKFSDLFERINNWLKLNKDWRICSMQTLIYDCASQFNHLKSSIYAQYLPRNTRGLRLYLSPSKSKFSGPQKIGCINVVPRKISGSYSSSDPGAIQYENADQILQRLNELLITKTIEGRILSVDVVTLPLIKGYVDTESNYIADDRLNGLYQRIYCRSLSPETSNPQAVSGHEHLIDILRVYYEFGHTTCGLVNLIDFIPRFYSPTPTDTTDRQRISDDIAGRQSPLIEDETSDRSQKTIAAESMTRLIRRSLAWFENEQKETLTQQNMDGEDKNISSMKIKLKLCNLQVLSKTVTKRDLLQIDGSNAIDILNTRSMSHSSSILPASMICETCQDSKPEAKWCIHNHRLLRLFDVKFVRLAYVIPIQNRSSCSIQAPERWRLTPKISSRRHSRELAGSPVIGSVIDSNCYLQTDQQLSESSNSLTCSSSSSDSVSDADCCSGSDLGTRKDAIDTNPLAEISLKILKATSDRHLANERMNQSRELEDHLNNSPVGQLTYRLFAPCQLVTSSSCFSINPVNSSSPLSRRGSVNLNGNESSTSSQVCSLLQTGTSGNQTLSQQGETDEPVKLNSKLYEYTGQFVVPSVIKSVVTGNSSSNSGQHRLSISESEQVEAIRRRMEVYVTTNLMKVVAGETIVVNLSNSLSCLSSALEQTVVESQHFRVEPSTWISVSLLYVGVGKPQLPQQLLAEAKIRELIMNKNLTENPTEEEVDCLFDSDFNGCLNADNQPTDDSEKVSEEDGSSQTFCNTAYERTVALPTEPEKDDDSSSFDASTIADLVKYSMSLAQPVSPVMPNGRILGARVSKRKSRKNDVQCSII